MTVRGITEIGRWCVDLLKHNPSHLPVTLLLGLADEDAAIYEFVVTNYLGDSQFSEAAVGALKDALRPSASLFFVNKDDGYPHNGVRPETVTSINTFLSAVYNLSLAQAQPEMSGPNEFLATVSRDLTIAYHASIAALLPFHRQFTLAGQFEFGAGVFRAERGADYGPMGERLFFTLTMRLLLQRWLGRRGLSLPIWISGSLFGRLDTDWNWALWRLVFSARDPVFVSCDDDPFGQNLDRLRQTDWAIVDIPVLRADRRKERLYADQTTLSAWLAGASDDAQ